MLPRKQVGSCRTTLLATRHCSHCEASLAIATVASNSVAGFDLVRVKIAHVEKIAIAPHQIVRMVAQNTRCLVQASTSLASVVCWV